MKYTIKILFIGVIFFSVSALSSAQIGIGTDTPDGMVDLKSTTTGFVFPRVILTATNVANPVTNPNGGAIVAGTVVYNTNTTSTGSKDVNPGIYAWDGSQWVAQYIKEDSEIFEQSVLDLRVSKSGSYVDVPGLGSGSSFTAKYTGTYRLKANFNFGAGEINPPSSPDLIRMATQEGYFRFTFNGTDHYIYTHAYSIRNEDIGSGTDYNKFRHDSSLVLYVNLVTGVTYNFRLSIDVLVSSDFLNGGDSGEGKAHVGIGIPCTVEFTFVEEN